MGGFSDWTWHDGAYKGKGTTLLHHAMALRTGKFEHGDLLLT
jgi:hypothetical protein